VDHGTMCAYDVLIGAPKATLLDFPILSASAPGGSTSGRTLSVAMTAFSQLFTSWGVSFAPGGVSKYAGLVVNNSWGIFHPSWDFPVGHRGRYIDNPRHPFNLLVAAMAGSGIDLLFAAGNCGPTCADMRCIGRSAGAIMGANAHADVLTVAGCDNHDQIVGYSSQGPSIAGMPPQKPDITGYTHFLGSEAFSAREARTPVPRQRARSLPVAWRRCARRFRSRRHPRPACSSRFTSRPGWCRRKVPGRLTSAMVSSTQMLQLHHSASELPCRTKQS
jgi:hypothetical protein